MSHNTPAVVHRPVCPIVGLSIVTTLKETSEQGTVKQMYDTVVARGAEIPNRVGTALLLVQLYPMDREFNDQVPYTVIVGAPVENLDRIPPGMIGHTVPDGDYAMVTHVGPDSGLGDTYQYLYGPGLNALGRQPAGHDFEVWDERYMPERADNALDIYAALEPMAVASAGVQA